MAMSKAYRMIMDGKEYIGAAHELAEVSGYCLRTIGNIARGEMLPRKGIEIEEIGELVLQSGTMRFCAEWNNAISAFKKVEWVRKGTPDARKLEVTK